MLARRLGELLVQKWCDATIVPRRRAPGSGGSARRGSGQRRFAGDVDTRRETAPGSRERSPRPNSTTRSACGPGNETVPSRPIRQPGGPHVPHRRHPGRPDAQSDAAPAAVRRRDTESRPPRPAAADRARRRRRSATSSRAASSLLMSGAEVATHVVGRSGPRRGRARRAGANVTTAVAAPQPTTPGAFAAGGGTGRLAGRRRGDDARRCIDERRAALEPAAPRRCSSRSSRRTSGSRRSRNVMRARHDTAKAAVSNIRA